MSNDKITAAAREPYDAMGPIDTPNPPAARATLADVQPGGTVRLGDQAERARFEAWGRTEGLPLARGKFGGYPFEVTAKAWRAWQYLSTRPSPGGQGEVTDDMVKAALGPNGWSTYNEEWSSRDRMRAALAAGLAARQPVYVQGCDELRARTESERAAYMEGFEEGKKIAARQPVGEPVIDYEDLVDQAKDLIQCGCSVNGAFDWLLEQLTDGEALAAPPTQAVDLGRARASIQSLLNWIDDWAETPEESGIDAIEAEAEAVLALIDGKAVGNG